MPLSDTFLVTGCSPAGVGDTICGVNCVRPRSEGQEVIYCPPRLAGPPDAELQCTYTGVADQGAAYAIVAMKPAWMWGVEAGANECGVTVVCVATASATNSEAHLKGSLLAQDLARLGLERGNTASAAVGAVCEVVEEYGLGKATADGVGSTERATYACLVFMDRNESWLLEIAGKLWAARHLKDGICCLAHVLCAVAPFDKASSPYLVENNDRWLMNVSGESMQEIQDDKRYCLRHNSSHEGQDMFHHLRKAAATSQLSHNQDVVTSMVSMFSATSDAAVHWFTATPDPNISIFKPFVFHSHNKQCSLTQTPKDGTPGSSGQSSLVMEQLTSTVRLQNNDGKLRDILLQLESECEQEMSCYMRRTTDGDGSYDSEGLGTIFNELCEAEIKFYKKASV